MAILKWREYIFDRYTENTKYLSSQGVLNPCLKKELGLFTVNLTFPCELPFRC